MRVAERWLGANSSTMQPPGIFNKFACGLRDRIIQALDAQRGFLFSWTPVCLALGIGVYFSLLKDPSSSLLQLVGILGLVLCYAGARLYHGLTPLIFALGLMALGFAMAGWRAHHVAGPVLDFRYYGAVEGRLTGLDRSGSGALRLTLDQVVLERMSPADTPKKIRISLIGDRSLDAGFEPGDTVLVTGHLSPPGGPAEPGDFDFRRHAWFQELGAHGYARLPVLRLKAAQTMQASGKIVLAKIRKSLSDRAFAGLGGALGGFAAVILSGDRSHLDQGALQDLRHSNLAHLLAISGLHMGLLTGFVFGLLRLLLVLIPQARQHWPIKQIAACGAMCAATFYLLLSGGSVATERAWVMAVVALAAILVNRRALSLRAVAWAALIVLTLRPEALLSPGFQMSFAATTALVAVFENLRNTQFMSHIPTWLRPAVSLMLSSFIAGAATAPVAMAHFNMISHYGYIANLTALPVMGVIVMPMAVLAALGMLFGLEALPLFVMGIGLDWILFVADVVSSWKGAVGYVVSAPWLVLPLLSLGSLFFGLWRGAERWLGLICVAVSITVWAQSERPLVLISEDGGQVGILTEAGRGLSKIRGAGFVSGIWLENDGGPMEQAEAADLWPGWRDGGRVGASLHGLEILHIQGKKAARTVTGCGGANVIVANTEIKPMPGCLVLTPKRLRQSGAIALVLQNWKAGQETDTGGPRSRWNIIKASAVSGTRMWSVQGTKKKIDPIAENEDWMAHMFNLRID